MLADVLSLSSAALAGAGLAQAGAGWVAVARFRARRPPAPRPPSSCHWPPITVLKPLHGDEPLLEEALLSNFRQDYPVFQLVFGLHDPHDPALPILHRLAARFPAVPVSIVVDRTQHGANRKIGNLINMLPHARHDLLVIADSDMHVTPDYLARLAAALEGPGDATGPVGLVTTLYAGRPATGAFVSRLGAAQINHAFLPGALLARGLGRQDCLGATMALRRDVLERVGGLHALKDHLADDATLGALVRAQGFSVALADTVPATTVPETEMPALIRHELRWACTIRSLAPGGFALSAVQYPLFWAALALGVSGGAGWAWLLFTLAWLVRGAVAATIDRDLGSPPSLTIWCLPLRDLLSVMIMFASYHTRRVAWRGQILVATGSGFAPGKG